MGNKSPVTIKVKVCINYAKLKMFEFFNQVHIKNP